MKITIIMPLYNAEKYLREALDSVLEQKLTDFELLCVNDASTDLTLEILEEYRARDNRILIFTNPYRMGAGASRNEGIKRAKGEYLIFLDGDDMFDEYMLWEAYTAAKKENADIVEFQYAIVTSEQIHKKIIVEQDNSFIERFCKKCFKVAELQPSEFLNLATSPWSKIYRREYILNERIEFQDLPCCNDVYFVLLSLLLAERIIYLHSSRIMVYARKHNTLTRISNDRDPMCAYYADEKLAEALVWRKKMPEVYRHFFCRTYWHLLRYIKETKDRSRAESFYLFLQKQGIEKLQYFGGKEYESLDSYVKEGFCSIQKESFSSQWYADEGGIQPYLWDKMDRIKELFRQWSQQGIKAGIWGAGQNGRCFIKFCQQNHLPLEAVVDNKVSIQGKKIYGYGPVISVQKARGKVQKLLITNKAFQNEMEKTLREMNADIEVIDIDKYIGRIHMF